MINTYSPTNAKEQKENDQNIAFIINSINEYYPKLDVVLGGDLNRNYKSAKKLAENLNLKLANNQLNKITRSQKINSKTVES